MALLTKKRAYDILAKIWETGGLTEAMGADIQRLKDDFDEREGFLKKYGEVYDGEDKAEYDYLPKEIEKAGDNDLEEKYQALQGEYSDLKKRYISAFFNGVETEKERDRTIENQVEDAVTDGKPQSWDELILKADKAESEVENAN